MGQIREKKTYVFSSWLDQKETDERYRRVQAHIQRLTYSQKEYFYDNLDLNFHFVFPTYRVRILKVFLPNPPEPGFLIRFGVNEIHGVPITLF